MQGDAPTVWCLCDPDAPALTLRFMIVGTGHEVPDSAIYCGSCEEGPLLWHLFELFEQHLL